MSKIKMVDVLSHNSHKILNWAREEMYDQVFESFLENPSETVLDLYADRLKKNGQFYTCSGDKDKWRDGMIDQIKKWGKLHYQKPKTPQTNQEWLETLPEPIRTMALTNMSEILAKLQSSSMANAIASSFTWANTPENIYFWAGIHECAGGDPEELGGNNPDHLDWKRATVMWEQAHAAARFFSGDKPAINLDKPPTKQKETEEMKLDKYEHIPVATPTLVYGFDISQMSANQVIERIVSLKQKKESLIGKNIKSTYIDQEVAKINKAIDVLIKHLNTFAEKAE